MADKVHLYDDSTLKTTVTVSGGEWEVLALSLTAGGHILKARTEDTAGNLSGYSSVKRIITGCTRTPECFLLDDSGVSAGDNITNNNTPRINISVILPIPSGSSLVSENSVSSLKLYEKTDSSTYNLINTISDPYFDDYDMYINTMQISTALSDGVHVFCASWVDAQGNESAKGSELSVTIDTAAPNAPTIDTIYDGQVFVGTSINVNGSISA